jgi:hypothetical protein
MISVLVFRFIGDDREWPLYASAVSRKVYLRWKAQFKREIARRERDGLVVVGQKAVVKREPAYLGVEMAAL